MRAEVAATVVDLVVERGYDQTTVDDICAAAGISRSSFFRYFPSKEDALFSTAVDEGQLLLEALSSRPATDTPWTAMRRALDSVLQRYEVTDERARRITRLIVNNPALAARHREKSAHWLVLLRPEVARRLGADPDDVADPRTDALIGAAMSCVDAALAAWTSSDHPPELPKLLDLAMGIV